jgi:serine/threonine-protein kinase
MELVDGPSLASRLSKGPLSLSDSLRIVSHIARGLVAAHSVGVLHRDLKPDNVLLMDSASGRALYGEERAVITDFGIARLVADRAPAHAASRVAEPPLTACSIVMGTPEYMSPEQLEGGVLDGRSDVYALGLVLFELLTGRLAFEGPTPSAIINAKLHHEAPGLRAINGLIPDTVALLVRAMLSRRRDERPDAAAVLERVETLRGARLRDAERTSDERRSSVGSGVFARGTHARATTISVLPVHASDAPLESFAQGLGDIIADEVVRVRSLTVVPPLFATAAWEPTASAPPDVVLTGSVRAEGDRVRVNLRLIDCERRTERWCNRFDGLLSRSFQLEDTIAATLRRALHLFAPQSARGHAALDERTERALVDAHQALRMQSDPEQLKRGIAIAREALAHSPDTAPLLSVLSFLLTRLAILGDGDRVLLMDAEDNALRALDLDRSNAQTFTSLGLIRQTQGDTRAAVECFGEALQRDASDAEALAYIGRILAEAGRVDEGIAKIEAALEIDPQLQHAWWALARHQALRGEGARSFELLREAALLTNNQAIALLVASRIAFWRRDRTHVRVIADSIAQLALPASHPTRLWLPMLRAFALDSLRPQHLEPVRRLAAHASAPSTRAFWLQVISEQYLLLGLDDDALRCLEDAAAGAFFDVHFLDHCPLTEPIRSTERFGRLRAIVATRAASLWRQATTPN